MLDAKKCCMKILEQNTIQHDFLFFYEMLDEIGAFKRIQNFVQHRKFRMLDEMVDPFKSALTTHFGIYPTLTTHFGVYLTAIIIIGATWNL